MIIFVIDDEKVILEGEAALIRQCAPQAKVLAFLSPADALSHLKVEAADVVFLDLEMPGYHGIDLAKHMKYLCPHLNIIFATAYQNYYEEAMSLRASGYLLKPLKAEHVIEELENLRYAQESLHTGLYVRAFGSFEVFYDGRPLIFKYQKTKELFAYLIDRRGAVISRDELITVLWGGETRRDSYYKQVQKDLNDTLKSVGMESILIKQRNSLGLVADQIRCDYYNWIHGKPEGINAYMGEYMRQYDWAEQTHVNIDRKEGRGG